MYHITKVQHLIEGYAYAPGSQGILTDGGMCNGAMHGDGIGVYAYAYPPYEIVESHGECALVELKMHSALTGLRSGSKGRYILKAEQTNESIGALCPDAEVRAICFLYETVPHFAKF